MKRIYLHGSLGEKYGQEFELLVNSPKEAITAIGEQKPGFYEDIFNGHWEVYRDEDAITTDELGLLCMTMNNCDELHIVPAIEGDKSGAGKIIMGVMLIAVAVALPAAAGLFASPLTTSAVMATNAFAGITYGQIAMLGAAITLGGISQMMYSVPGGSDDAVGEEAGNRNSFDSAGNTTEEGGPVPIHYGTDFIGSKVIQASLVSSFVPKIEWYRGDNSFTTTIVAGSHSLTANVDSYTPFGGQTVEYEGFRNVNWTMSNFEGYKSDGVKVDAAVNGVPYTDFGTSTSSTLSGVRIYGIYTEYISGSLNHITVLYGKKDPINWHSSDTSIEPQSLIFDKLEIVDSTDSVIFTGSMPGHSHHETYPLVDDDGLTRLTAGTAVGMISGGAAVVLKNFVAVRWVVTGTALSTTSLLTPGQTYTVKIDYGKE